VNRCSFIDHFVVSTVLYDTSIAICTVRHDGNKLSEKSILWHNIPLECSRPRDGAVADIMRRACAEQWLEKKSRDLCFSGISVK